LPNLARISRAARTFQTAVSANYEGVEVRARANSGRRHLADDNLPLICLEVPLAAVASKESALFIPQNPA